MISCLININKYAIHGDLKFENIVYDDDTNTSIIIDYGLSHLFPITTELMKNITLGNRQISVEIIMAYLQKNFYSENSNKILNNLYSEYLDSIQKTIDNFGLFWIIIESITTTNIFNKYFSSEEIIHSQTIDLLYDYLNFYFNLQNNEKSTELTEKLKENFNYTPSPDLRKTFINDVSSKISSEKFRFYFDSDEKKYLDFMEKVLALVRVDPTKRISKEELLKNPFFHKNTRPLTPSVPNNSPKPQFRLPNIANNLLNRHFILPSVKI